MSNKPDDQSVAIADAAVAQKMFPDRSTAEVVADIVAAEPGKHNVPLAERLRRAQQSASAGDEDAWEAFCRARISEIGGDFDEMLPGNKPRYTVEENGDVKDHDTGQVHKAIEEAPPASPVEGAPAEQVGHSADATPAASSTGDQHGQAAGQKVATQKAKRKKKAA